MSTRRSSRLAVQEQPKAPEPAIVEVAKPKKVQAPTEVKAPAKETASVKKNAPAKEKRKPPKSPVAETEQISNHDALSKLPAEILNMIVAHIVDPQTLSKLGRSCKRYYSLTMPVLYERIAVAVPYHAHIAKLIRTFEPHLTIAQKKHLKKVGAYKGQREKYPTSIDPYLKPICATHVRQMVIGSVSPGKNHAYIVFRYLDEVFKNLKNLEIVETQVMTRDMAESLASMKNLRALRLFSSDFDEEAMELLGEIKDLRHLHVKDMGYSHRNIARLESTQSLLHNSRSTLRSLSVSLSPYASSFLPADIPTGTSYFTALESLSLADFAIDDSLIKSLSAAFDFGKMRELKLGRFGSRKDLLFGHLESLASGLRLQSLSLDLYMVKHTHGGSSAPSVAEVEPERSFISSFNTLRTLELKSYNLYSENNSVDPGLIDSMQQAILQHKDLKILKFSYNSIPGGCKLPCLSAASIEAILNGLQHLEELEFALTNTDLPDIGRALSRGSHLKTIDCALNLGWWEGSGPDESSAAAVAGILEGYLSSANGDDKTFVWEDQFPLKNITVYSRKWEVASKFEKAAKGMKKAQKLKIDGSKRQVMYRDVSWVGMAAQVRYGPDTSWVEKVSRDIY